MAKGTLCGTVSDLSRMVRAGTFRGNDIGVSHGLVLEIHVTDDGWIVSLDEGIFNALVACLGPDVVRDKFKFLITDIFARMEQ